MTIAIKNVNIELVMPNDEVKIFNLKAPNSEQSFYFVVKKVVIRASYRDANKVTQRERCLYDVHFYYNYQSHSMNLLYLITAKNIYLKAPPNFLGTYETHEVVLINDEVKKDWVGGLAAAGLGVGTPPSGSATLHFKTKTPLTDQQLLDIKKWDEDFAK